MIVLAGSTAVQSYLNIDEPISKLRGQWIVRGDIKYMPIFHPSYLLRNASKEKGKPKWLTWEDMKEVKQALLDDPELSNEERFEIYYKHRQIEKEIDK